MRNWNFPKYCFGKDSLILIYCSVSWKNVFFIIVRIGGPFMSLNLSYLSDFNFQQTFTGSLRGRGKNWTRNFDRFRLLQKELKRKSKRHQLLHIVWCVINLVKMQKCLDSEMDSTASDTFFFLKGGEAICFIRNEMSYKVSNGTTSVPKHKGSYYKHFNWNILYNNQ